MNALKTMADYIYATPDRVRENLEQDASLCHPLISLFTKKTYRKIVFVASGSSFTALQCVRNYVADMLDIDVAIINPYTFAHYDVKQVHDDHFVVVVTQSGASTNCIEALKKLKAYQHETIVLTGNPNCDCKAYAEHVLDWGCGIETMGYVTLGVVCLIVYMQLFAAYTHQMLHPDTNTAKQCRAQIEKAMQLHKEMCGYTEDFIVAHEKELMEMQCVYVLGCGSNYGVALEGALKIGETIKVPTIAYELDEFLHGPALQLTPNYHIFVIDSHDDTSDHAQQAYEALQKVSNHVFLIGHHDNDPHAIACKDTCEEPFTCLYHLPYFELIAERISTKLDSKLSHPLYYEMTKIMDFRTAAFRKLHPAEED